MKPDGVPLPALREESTPSVDSVHSRNEGKSIASVGANLESSSSRARSGAASALCMRWMNILNTGLAKELSLIDGTFAVETDVPLVRFKKLESVGLVIVAVGGTAVVGISIILAFVVPLLIFFSPVLIPLGIVLFLAAAGTVSAVGSGILAISGISWLYNYCNGRDPPGANRVDAARERIVCTAREFKEWASNYSSQMRAAPSA
ncbi:hypothetical protein AXG93_2956s1170 [Marchantia polymorpha subsp. ruderalis]|uniref:Oleosin n=1 Tax=Marchantia polymorpha subsp. ruderalis TaxID=1480154 RepID=A0A176WDR1_MARPO|nr:hypothetical protein AXG93_2956s1170 [Marchantia polymorpha subsp. ruderalis]